MEKRHILITGGTGFLGLEICKQLRKKFGDDVVLYSLSRQFNFPIPSIAVQQLSYDLQKLSSENILEILEKYSISVIFHTAAKAGIWGRKEDFFQMNEVVTAKILDAAKQMHIKYFIYTSSPSVVFDRSDLENVNETTAYPQTFTTYYAESKARAEALVLKSHGNEGILQTISLRPHLIIGPGDPHLLPNLVSAFKRGRLKQIGSGHNLVDVIHVSNAAKAHLLSLEHLEENEKHGGKSYFVGQERPVPLWQMINKLLATQGLGPINMSTIVSFKMAYFMGSIFEVIYKTLGIYNTIPPMTRFMALQLGKSHYFSQQAAFQDLGYRPDLMIADAIASIKKYES